MVLEIIMNIYVLPAPSKELFKKSLFFLQAAWNAAGDLKGLSHQIKYAWTSFLSI
jgi:hypothetical protein